MLLRSLAASVCRVALGFFKFCEIPSPPAATPVRSLSMSPEKDEPAQKPAPVIIPANPDDDFNEPLGERQPGANDAIVCEGGCQ